MNTYMETPRLILRDWKEEDIPVFAGLNSNDQVMEFFLKKLSYQETLDFSQPYPDRNLQPDGYGLYAVEKKEDHSFIGYVGLHDCYIRYRFCSCHRDRLATNSRSLESRDMPPKPL